MKMLVALSFHKCLLNLTFRQRSITNIRRKQRLHGRERTASVDWGALEPSIDSFLGLLPSSKVLKCERSLKRDKRRQELLGITHRYEGLLVFPLVQQGDGHPIAAARIQRIQRYGFLDLPLRFLQKADMVIHVG